jgi:hypothetical protein
LTGVESLEDEQAVDPPARAPHPEDPGDLTRQRRTDWSSLMKRTWGVDVLRCPNCDGRMQLVAVIDDPAAAVRILAHLGLPTRPPPRAPPWPRQAQLAFAETHEGVDPPAG